MCDAQVCRVPLRIQHRRLHLPYHQEVITIEIVALAPLRVVDYRVIMLIER
jgi:hypothetical protein